MAKSPQRTFYVSDLIQPSDPESTALAIAFALVVKGREPAIGDISPPIDPDETERKIAELARKLLADFRAGGEMRA